MSKFRKKPVVIEAALFDGVTVGDRDLQTVSAVIPGTCPEWFPAVLEEKAPNDFGWKPGDVCSLGDKIYIATLEGTMTACPGDWIIRGIQGELYPCKPDIFAATYEVVSDIDNAALSQSGGDGARFGVTAPDAGIAGTYAWFTKVDDASEWVGEFALNDEIWDLVTGLKVQ